MKYIVWWKNKNFQPSTVTWIWFSVISSKGSEEVLGVPFPKADKREKWIKISSTKDFWANLEWMMGAQRMWTFINRYDAHILSAYSTKDPNSRKGKLAWLKSNAKLTKKSRIHLVLRADKQRVCNDKR